MKLSELASLLGSSVAALKEDFEVTGISTLEEAGPTDISFISDQKYSKAKLSWGMAYLFSREQSLVPTASNTKS